MEQLLFDYQSAAKELKIPPKVVRELEEEVKQEFPNDAMLRELHILRALNMYANKYQPMYAHEK
jgi:hypothetical protein